MAPLVSILIPAYNAEKWIRETIHSALAQTWPSKEIIIVNDGSTDNTLEICKQYESKILKVFTQKHQCASFARNAAFKHSQGDYIQWLDADDLLAPDKISEQMKYINGDKKGLTLLYSPHGKFYWRHEKARFIPNSLWGDMTSVEWLIRKFSENVFSIPAAWLMSRKIIELAGDWDERLSLNDDGEFVCRVVAESEGIKFIKEAKSYYRQSGFNQLSRKRSEEAIKSLVLSVNLSIEHLMGLEDSNRTRMASIKLLHQMLPLIYPEKIAFIEEIKELVYKLGGDIIQFDSDWKLIVLGNVFGFGYSRKFLDAYRDMKIKAKALFDFQLYKIEKIKTAKNYKPQLFRQKIR